MRTLRLFGTSGIRGVANVEITTEMATKLGLTFAAFLGNEGTVAIGRDVRLPAKLLHHAFISGVMAGGVNVEDCGLAPTPAVLWVVKNRKLDGAAVVTGSHTPAEMIGFLFFLGDTAELSVQESHHFERLFFNEAKPVAWNAVGTSTEVDESDLYLQSVLEQVNLRKIAASGFKVALDPGHGASAPTSQNFLRAIGVAGRVINGEPNGLFPNRDPYPRPEVLQGLAREVKESGADFGSATDADGDRAIFVDGDGEVLWGDSSGCLFVKAILMKHREGSIVAPINTSQVIDWVCDAYNGRLTSTKVGPPNIVSALKREKAAFGLEETGKNIWPEAILYGDWLLTTLKMLEILANEQKGLAELVQEFPRFHMKKEAIFCPEQLKDRVLVNALSEWRKKGEEAEVVNLDGIKLVYSDNSWLLLRPSGTEPVFRVYAESKDPTTVQKLRKIGSELIKNAITRAQSSI